jgi:hypothetical protein
MSQACMWPGLGPVAQKIFGFKLCSNDSSPLSYRIFQTFTDHFSHWKSSSITPIIWPWHNQKHQYTQPQCTMCWKPGSKLPYDYTCTFTGDCLWKAQPTPANCYSAPHVKLYTPKQCRQNFKKITECWRWGTVMATKLHSISSQYISKNFLLLTLCCSYLCTDVTVLRTNLSNALMYVNTTLFILWHSYMFQPSWGHPQGVLILFATKYMSRCKHQIKEQRVATAT